MCYLLWSFGVLTWIICNWIIWDYILDLWLDNPIMASDGTTEKTDGGGDKPTLCRTISQELELK